MQKRGNVQGTWNLQSFTAVKGSLDSIKLQTGYDLDSKKKLTIHPQKSLDYIDSTRSVDVGMASNQDVGFHTRLEISKKANEVTFLTVFWPYKCSETPPTMSKTEKSDYACITINNFNGNDVFHHAKLSNTTVNHTNPYNFTNCNAVLSYDAESAMLKKSRSNSINFGNCTSNTNFRIAAIDNGTFLTYHDTIYISTSQNINTAYELTGRYKYQGFIENNTGGDIDVTFFLPDCEPQYDMKAVTLKQNLLPYSYNNGEKKITITFPTGITNFEIKLTDPCLASCFFPPVAIDTLFEFNTGTTEQLGHNLDINEPYGHLKITNGSKMEICSEIVMVNHDSITMLGLYEKYDESLPLYTQYTENGDAVLDSSGKKVDDRFGSKKSMIIIKQDAGLVLLPNSHTHIGANSTILVKKGGTLLIQEYAHIEIGSPDYPGYGEIIAEDSAYVCIDPNADIHFYNNPADSSDKNIFYVFNPSGDTIYLIGGGIKTSGTVAGVNPNGNYSRFGSNNCTGFCDFKNYSPPHGINNRDFGWANINYPVAVAQMVDTFCFGSNVTVKAKRTLNETKWHFEICEYDGANCVPPVTYVPFKGYDTVRIGEYNLSDEFNFEEGKLYKIRFVAENDCHETNLVDNLVFISSLPYATFDIPANACPGSGTLLASNGQHSAYEYKYKWSVSMLGQDNYHPDDEDAYYYEKTYTYNGQAQDSFVFSGFRFYGNRQYEVELSVYGYCGVATKTDTVNVPYGVYLEPDEATVYFDGFGDTTIQLNGSVYGFSSYNWNPTTYLSNSAILNPVSYPTAPVTYILSASGNGCSDADTLSIAVNYYANAGSDKIICKGDSIELGFSGKTIPSTMYIDWKPTVNMDDSTIVNPTVFPSVTTIYTMNIRLKSNNSLVEADEVIVYVDSAVSPSFLTNEYIIAEDSIILYFENSSEPYLPTTTYSWTFGDGSDTSHLVNVYHTFYKQTVDTFFVVCLKTTTSCSDSTYCDTVFYKADSNEWEFWIPEIATVEELITIDNSYLIGNIPNPFRDQTTIKYHLAENTANAEIVIYNMFGKHVKTIKLRPNSDTYSLDWSAFAKGIYSYSLLIDGIIKDSKKMIKL